MYAFVLSVPGQVADAEGRCSIPDGDVALQSKSETVLKMVEEGLLVAPVLCVGDGYTDMEIRLQGNADFAVGFGVHVQRERTRQVADAFVETLQECEQVLQEQLELLLPAR